MEKSPNSTPVPVPRPRQRANNNSSANTEIDKVNNNNDSSQDVPDCISSSSKPYISPYPKLDYENVEIVLTPKKPEPVEAQNDESRPVPAPRRTKVVIQEGDDTVRTTFYQNVTPVVTTGAIRKPNVTPTSPAITTVHNDLRSNVAPISPSESSPKRFSFDGEDPSFRRSESDGVSVGSSDSSGRKYKTTSPGELFKTIGATSRLLTESITERVTHKTKKVATKLDKNLKSSKSSIATWSSEASSKFKNVSKSINTLAEDKLSLSLTKNKTKRSNSTGDDDFLERRQTAPPENSDLMRNIQFNSPLNNKVNNREDLTKGSSSSSTYDIPKNAKRTNFEDPPPYEPSSLKSKSNSSASLASASSSSTNPPVGTFTRNSGLSQSLYSRVVPKKDRGGGDTPSPGPLRHKNKSESNLYGSKFYIDSVREVEIDSSTENIPPPTFPAPILQDSAKKESPYGKLNIIPRQRSSSSSSEEDNNLPEMLKRVHIRKKTDNYENVTVNNTGSAASDRATCNSVRRIFSRRSSSIDELRNNLNLRSDSWNFYDVSSREGTQREDNDEDDSFRLEQ